MWDVVVVAPTVVAALLLRRSVSLRLAMSPSRELDFFCAGAGMYVATFALVRSADYRLVFVLLTVPQLARWAAARRALAIATLLAVFATLWLPTGWPWENVYLVRRAIREWDGVAAAGGESLPLGALAQVVAFAGLAFLLAAAIHANWTQEPKSAEAPAVRVRAATDVRLGTHGSGNGSRS